MASAPALRAAYEEGKDYLWKPGSDTLVSPPNRADLQNTSAVGSWVSVSMAHEQQVIKNKYPFASTPHWVRYLDPATGADLEQIEYGALAHAGALSSTFNHCSGSKSGVSAAAHITRVRVGGKAVLVGEGILMLA